MAGMSRPEKEKQVLDFWRSAGIFEKHVKANELGPLFSFYEGPPTANGKPGIHHVLSRVYKDIYIRFRGLQGYHVPRKAGWDCHGLPVEREVEKQLGIQSKSEIETDIGLEKFNSMCRQSVMKYIDAWNEFTERLGFWVDLKDPYHTMDDPYIEAVWGLFKIIYDKGLVYQGYKVVPFDPVMGATMSDAEVALGYKTVEDPSITVKFRLTKESSEKIGENASFLVWTTTPWTLPSNVALALKEDADYGVYRFESEGQSELLIAAEELAESVFRPKKDKDKNKEVKMPEKIQSFKGSELTGLSYERLYDFMPADPDQKAWYTVSADFVTLDTGTGIVHLAPAYGADDLEAGKEHNLPVIAAAGLDGTFKAGPFLGQFFKEADKDIIIDLKKKGLMFRSEKYKHEYPFGWRTGAPLMYYAKDAWYIRTTQIRDQLIANNQKINWSPGHIQNGRFGNWLENNRDWALSRERYWGTPIPVWMDEDGNIKVVGSLEELSELAGIDLTGTDLHRPYIDEVTFKNPQTGKEMKRIPEVMDCWFDSGAMPYAQWGYPVRGAKEFEKYFPADFISEAIDQTRGWFYTLLAISTMVSEKPSYNNVTCLGHVLDAKGEKMSKSKGNTVAPEEVFNLHGADAIRWYFLTGAPPGNSRRVGKPDSKEDTVAVVHGFFNMLENSVEFYNMYAGIDKVSVSYDDQNGFHIAGAPAFEKRPAIDRWILSSLQELTKEVTASLENYDCLRAGRAIEQFTDSLSNWYIRRNRRRFWKGEYDEDKTGAYDTLLRCLIRTVLMLAPFVPFLAEDLYHRLTGLDLSGSRTKKSGEIPESIHLCSWPVADDAMFSESDLLEGDTILLAASLGRSARQQSGLKVRQPLSKMMIFTEDSRKPAIEKQKDVLLEELNVKEIEFLDDQAGILSYRVKPNLPRLGKRLGPKVKQLQQFLAKQSQDDLAGKLKEGSLEIELDSEKIKFDAEDFLIEGVSKEGTSGVEASGMLVALDTTLTPELIEEGWIRDIVRNVQELRKKSGLDVTDRIHLGLSTDSDRVSKAVQAFTSYIEEETLASVTGRTYGDSMEVDLDGNKISLSLEKQSG